MNWWRTILLVAKREIKARRRAFRISTSLIVSVVVLGLAALEISGVTEGAEIKPEDADEVLAYFGSVILFGTIVGYGQMTLMGVAEEKSSRVVEVVLGCVQPSLLLAGKIIGIGAFALAQMGAILGTAYFMLSTLDTVPLPGATGSALLAIFGYFLLGYAFYASVYAAFGALMSRTENASNAAGPLNLFVSIGYITAVISLSNPDNWFARLLSLIPPFTPTLMPMRIVQDRTEVWEVAASVVLMAVTISWVNRAAARIYIGGVMRGGAKTSLREAWRSATL